MLHKVVLTFESVNEILTVTIPIKVMEHTFLGLQSFAKLLTTFNSFPSNRKGVCSVSLS